MAVLSAKLHLDNNPASVPNVFAQLMRGQYYPLLSSPKRGAAVDGIAFWIKTGEGVAIDYVGLKSMLSKLVQ